MNPPNENINNEHIKLNLLAFRDILFECPALCRIRCQSKQLPDMYYPKILYKQYAALIQKLDPLGTYLTVFTYDTHCEVWLTHEWKDSNTYRMLRHLESESARLLVNESTELADSIFTRLTTKWCMPKNEVTRKIAKGIALNCHDQVLYERFGLLDLFPTNKQAEPTN